MEYCDDSPVKMKIRKSAKKANESSRQCILHVCDGGNEMVSHFSENSWKVRMLLFFLKEGSFIFFSDDLHFLVSKNKVCVKLFI